MNTKINSLLAIAVLFFVAAFSSIAVASPVLQISSGVITKIIHDGDVFDPLHPNNPFDANTDSSIVTFIGSIGAWTSNVITGQTHFGSNGEPVLDLNSVDTSSVRPNGPVYADLVIMLSDTGFSSSDLMRSYISSIGGTTQGTVSYKTYYGSSLFDLTNEVGNLYFTPTAFSGEVMSSGLTDQSFSMTQVVTISHPTGNGISSYNAMMSTPTPEPSSMILLGSGLLGTALFFRRKNLA
jgi:hypothetical protein